MSAHIIEIDGLCKRFGRQEILRGVDLHVPEGAISGFLGRNGAGKTTTLLALLGLLRPDSGTCRIMGDDSARDGVAIRRRVGYMAENQKMYDWMTVEQTLKWVSAFYPTWDHALAEELRNRFELDQRAKVRVLSKGQTSKLALLLALAHNPKVVVLDDPTLGLDPIARKDLLREVIGQLQERGVTVLFSSHLLYEIEPICDHIAILEGGRIIKSCATHELRDKVKRVICPVAYRNGKITVDGLLDAKIEGRVAALVTEQPETTMQELRAHGLDHLVVEDLNLDEIFEAYVIGRQEAGPFVARSIPNDAEVHRC